MDTFKKVRDRVQSIVYIPENLDGMMTLQNGVQTTVRYRVMPEAVATALATNYASTLSFIGILRHPTSSYRYSCRRNPGRSGLHYRRQYAAADTSACSYNY